MKTVNTVFSKVYLCFVGLCLLSFPSLAQFNPEVLSQSTVRLVVKKNGVVASVASGFVWKTPNQIVTSLHVVDDSPDSMIIVEFEKKRRKAVIKGMVPEADLVLLEVSRPIDGWVPLKAYEGKKPDYRSLVTALGFNKGALGMSTRELVKGYAKPELLSQLLPAKAARILARTNMPDVELPIYYLDGSLLPGYSGSPIVNSAGELIGIGNGGLESGASSVSWVIPANNLDVLEQSDMVEIPKKFGVSKKLFTIDKELTDGNAMLHRKGLRRHELAPDKPDYFFVNAIGERFWRALFPVANANTLVPPEPDLSWTLPGVEFIEVPYENFNFVRVKTRTYSQMLESSGRPESIESALQLFNHYFAGYKINTDRQTFDVYTDSHYGLNIIVPSQSYLTVDDGYLLAQGEIFCQLCPFEIQYYARTIGTSTQKEISSGPTDYLVGVSDEHWEELNQEGDYEEWEDFRQIDDYGSERHVLRAVYSDFEEPFKDVHELNYFIAATNRDSWFQAQGILNLFDEDTQEHLNQYRGSDCTVLHSDKTLNALCQKVNTSFQVLASTHFTSFSNRIMK